MPEELLRRHEMRQLDKLTARAVAHCERKGFLDAVEPLGRHVSVRQRRAPEIQKGWRKRGIAAEAAMPGTFAHTTVGAGHLTPAARRDAIGAVAS